MTNNTFFDIVIVLAGLVWTCFWAWVWWMLFWVLRWTYLDKRQARDAARAAEAEQLAAITNSGAANWAAFWDAQRARQATRRRTKTPPVPANASD